MYTLRTNNFLAKGSLKTKHLISWAELGLLKDDEWILELHLHFSMGLVSPSYLVHYDEHIASLIEQMYL